MALVPKNIPLSIIDGLDTKSDDKNVLYTKWLQAQNVDYGKTGAAIKRTGHAALTNKKDGGGTLSNVRALSTLKDELVSYANNKLYTYSEAKERWFDRGFVSNAVSTEQAVAVADTVVSRLEYATLNGVSCYAFSPDATSSLIKIRLLDEATSSVLAEHVVPATGITLLSVGTVGNSFIIIYRQVNSVKYVRIDFTDLNTVSAAVTLGATSTSVGDSCVIGTRLYIAWCNATSITITYLRADLTFPTAIDYAFNGSGRIGLSSENLLNVRVVGGGQTLLLDAGLNLIHNTSVFDAGLGSTNYCAIQDPEVPTQSYIFYCKSFDVSAQVWIKKALVTQTGTVTQLGNVLYGSNLVSKAQEMDGQIYMVVNKTVNDSVDLGQKTYYLVNAEGQIMGQCASQVGVKKRDFTLQKFYKSGTELSFYGGEYYQAFDIDAPSTSTSSITKRYTFDFSAVPNYYDAALGETLHIAGSVMLSYDSQGVVEHSFLEIPTAPVLGSLVDTSPSIGVGSTAIAFPQTLYYCVVYSWIDAKGQIHRSAPSTPLSVSIADDTTEVRLKVRPLTLTSKSVVEIEVYRTEANGKIFYKNSASSDIATVQNAKIISDPSLPNQSYRDIMPDSVLISQEVLYTTGGILENIAPNASRFLTTHKNRIVTLNADGTEIQFSKTHDRTVGVGFNDALVIKLDEFGLEGRALAPLDDTLIIFKRRAIFGLQGQGPNNAGEADDFTQPALIQSDVGCTDPGSVVGTPLGIMFKSEKGIYLLQRNMQVNYIGAAVERYNDYTVNSAVLMPEKNQVRFATTNGPVLVYDYNTNRWSTYEGLLAEDSLIYGTKYALLKSDGKVWLSNAEYSDNGSYIPIVLESAWIQASGFQGYQRFYKMLIQGSFKNAHKLKVSFAYDFNDSFIHECIIDTTALSGSNYGTGPYGDGDYGGASNAYEYEASPKRQKCKAFKFRLETVSTGVLGADVTLSQFLLRIGMTPNESKLPASRKFGAK